MARPFKNALAILFVAAPLALTASPARGEDPAVPLQLQVDLTVKVIEYVQAPPLQGLTVLRIGILARSGNVESLHFASELKASLGRMAQIAGRAHEETVITFTTPSAVREEIKRRQLFAVYFTPGLLADIPAISRALDGSAVLTVAAFGSYVTAGAILGFEIVSGRPKMLLNLGQARKQRVAFQALVMKVMRIVE